MGASAGRVLLIPKGDWNVNTTYTGLDWVRHNGAAWVCKNTCTGIEPTEANADNWQMMSKDGQNGSVINADAAMSDTSENPVQNKVIKSYVDTRTTFDSSMSDTSENPVQNKVIKSYVDNSIAGISDMTGATATQNGANGLVPAPQAGDEKKVLLGDGTWVAIDDKFSFSDHDTATSGTSFTDAEDGNMIVTDWTRNLLNPTLDTVTQNGVTCTNNGDGTYTLNGTATKATVFVIAHNIKTDYEEFKIIGCPKNPNSNNQAFKFDIFTTVSAPEEDYGNGKIVKNYGYMHGDARIVIYDTTIELDNVIFKPMLTTDLNATYDDFVPYGGYEIKSCGKNLLNPTLQTTTKNGVTCTNNGDGTYTLNGTASDKTYFDFDRYTEYKNGKYKLVGSIKGGAPNKYFLCYTRKSGGGDSQYEFGDGIILDIDDPIRFVLCIYRGITLENAIFKPMLTTDLSATYDDFEPYTGETITVTNDTESPAFGLKSHKGITNIISPANVKVTYPTNQSGVGVLNSIKNIASENIQQSNEIMDILGDYDLDNKFDGLLQQGYDANGSILESHLYVYSNLYSCQSGDIVSIIAEKRKNESYIAYYNGSTYKGRATISSSSEMKVIIPSDVTSFRFSIGNANGITPETAGHIGVYVNNSIDELKNELEKLKDAIIAMGGTV